MAIQNGRAPAHTTNPATTRCEDKTMTNNRGFTNYIEMSVLVELLIGTKRAELLYVTRQSLE
jgi:hypothetical protein